MSVAARFKFDEAFPICIGDFFAPEPNGWDHIGGLTLEDAMAFVWNIEEISFVTSGVCTVPRPFPLPPLVADIAGDFNFQGATTGGGWATNSLLFGSSLSQAMLRFYSAGDPAFRPTTVKNPYERVCSGTTLGLPIISFAFAPTGSSDGYLASNCQFNIWLAKDPSDPDLYALYYQFRLSAGDFSNAVVWFTNPEHSAGSSSGSYTTGSFAILGYTFDWRCYYNLSISLETLTVTFSSSFTYP